MIFVTLGTHEQQLNRLVKGIDDLIKNKIIQEEVQIQLGYSTYIPKYAKWFRFIDQNKFTNLTKKASIVISHGGSGNLLFASHMGKKVLAIPRLKKFGEHTNDHQLQIVKELEKEKRVLVIYDIKDLANLIQKTKKMKIKKYNPPKIVFERINSFLKSIEK
jgi:UDP-N-acetylglucosamine transferase subunit ALG13